jgi:putative transposase
LNNKELQQNWFVVITNQYDEPKYNDNGKYQTIDLGVSNLISAVNLDGKFIQFKNCRVDLYWKKKIKNYNQNGIVVRNIHDAGNDIIANFVK